MSSCTPTKSGVASGPLSTGMASPRLRSPRGTSPRNANATSWGFLRHTKSLLIVATFATMILMRPAGIDSRSMSSSSGLATTSSTTHKNAGAIDDDDQYQDATSDEDSTFDLQAPTDTLQTLSRINEDEPDSPSPDTESTSYDTSDPPQTTKSTKTSTSALLSLYNSTKTPVIGGNPPAPVDVHFIVDVSDAVVVGPQSKFILDGLERSSFTNVAGMTFLNPNLKQVKINGRRNTELVWIADWGSMHRDCHRLQKALTALKRKEEEHVLLVDYSGSPRQTQCDFWDEKIRVAKRSIVTGRHYDHHRKEINAGRIEENNGFSQDLPVLQAPLVVRERFISALKENSRDQNPLKSSRKTDVCFFWKRGDYSHYGFWRRDVSNYIKQLGKSNDIKIHVDIAANDEDGMEIGNLQLNYVDYLLRCKIVVIAQRDEWEDHYRLYESLASGAMVLMDPMLSMPEGLKNKTNVGVYDSLDSLKSQVEYYLEHESRRKSAARRGMELALGYYRSWHRLEQLIFGRPLTLVNKAYDDAPEKVARPSLNYQEEVSDIFT